MIFLLMTGVSKLTPCALISHTLTVTIRLVGSYKVNQFFDYYQTPLYQRVRMASFHMEGEVLVWFQDADEVGQFPTWEAFL
jgi:hypothetical protein